MNFDAYKNPAPFPVKPSRPKMPAPEASSEAFGSYAADLKIWELTAADITDKIAAWKAVDKAAREKFVPDMLAELGYTDCAFVRALLDYARAGKMSDEEIYDDMKSLLPIWKAHQVAVGALMIIRIGEVAVVAKDTPA